MSTEDTTKPAFKTAARMWERYVPYQDLVVVYEGHTDLVPVRVPDISARGMFINTARRFPEGSVLKVKFRLTRRDVEVTARAEVRYCLEGVGIGIEFVEISPEHQQAIEEEMQQLAQALRPET